MGGLQGLRALMNWTSAQWTITRMKIPAITFRKPKKRPLAEPLRAIPQKAPGVDCRRGPGGCYHLRRTVHADGPVSRFFNRLIPSRQSRYVNLDERGTEFWKLINGKRNTEEIARKLGERWKIDEGESRIATVKYIHSL